MFKNWKLEARLVRANDRSNNVEAPEEPKPDYVAIADEATRRIGAKLLIGAVTLIVTTAVVAVLANAADTAIQDALTSE